jgi:hypothetical protein
MRRVAEERVRVYKPLRDHPLLGAMGLERETGLLSMTSPEGRMRRSEAIAGLFRCHRILDIFVAMQVGYRIRTFIRDPRSGTLYVGKSGFAFREEFMGSNRFMSSMGSW